jgi:two-component system response regulator FimZ (fimbrial Z protein)
MIKILLVEKNIIFSNALTKLLNKDAELNVVGVCKEGNDIIKFLTANPIDVIVIDPNQSNGFVITVQIKKEYPRIKIIGYSAEGESTKKRMLAFGASSYLSKYEANIEDVIAEIKNCYTVFS